MWENNPDKISTAINTFLAAVIAVLTGLSIIDEKIAAGLIAVLAAANQLVASLIVQKQTVAIKPLTEYAEAVDAAKISRR